MRNDGRFVVGVDLGQTTDFTAVVVAERVLVAVPDAWEIDWASHEPVYDLRTGRRLGPRKPKMVPHYHLRHAERFERGLPYPVQVARVAEGLAALPLHGRSELVVDRTGVGRAVFDMFEAARLDPIGVTITAGVDALRAAENDWRVPKRDLVAAIQAPLGEGRLKIAAGLLAGEILLAELQNFRIKVSLTGHDSYAAGESAEWREGQHDDLVLAAALALWWAVQPPKPSNVLMSL